MVASCWKLKIRDISLWYTETHAGWVAFLSRSCNWDLESEVITSMNNEVVPKERRTNIFGCKCLVAKPILNT